jgi:hypothetical protein
MKTCYNHPTEKSMFLTCLLSRPVHFRNEIRSHGLCVRRVQNSVNTPETSVNFYQTTLCNIPEDSLPLLMFYLLSSYCIHFIKIPSVDISNEFWVTVYILDREINRWCAFGTPYAPFVSLTCCLHLHSRRNIDERKSSLLILLFPVTDVS